MAFFRTYISASLGNLGFKDIFTDVNLTRAQIRGVGGGFPGEVAPLFGNLYQLVQNRSGGDLNACDAVSLYFGAASRIGNLTGASTTSVLTTDDTFDAGMSDGRDVWPGVVGVTAGVFATTADEALRRILANSVAAGASTATVGEADFSDGMVNGVAANSPDVISGPPDATYDYEAFCPWEVVKTDLDALGTSFMQGIVRSTTITNGNFGVIQIAGYGLAKVDGTTDLVAGDMLIPDSAAGVLSKWTIAGANPTAAEAFRGRFECARIFGAYTNNGVGLRLVEIHSRPLIPHPIQW